MNIFMKDLFDKCYKKSAGDKNMQITQCAKFKTKFHIYWHKSKIFPDLNM